MSKSFGLPVQCVSVISQHVERHLPDNRDLFGKIDPYALKLAVMETIDNEDTAMAEWIRREAWALAISTQVDFFLRQSKSPYVVAHRDQKAFEQRTKPRQRDYVSFRDAGGEIVHKERRYLTKSELLLVVKYYNRRIDADQDVINWCLAAYQQMELLGDEAIVADILEDAV